MQWSEEMCPQERDDAGGGGSGSCGDVEFDVPNVVVSDTGTMIGSDTGGSRNVSLSLLLDWLSSRVSTMSVTGPRALKSFSMLLAAMVGPKWGWRDSRLTRSSGSSPTRCFVQVIEAEKFGDPECALLDSCA